MLPKQQAQIEALPQRDRANGWLDDEATRNAWTLANLGFCMVKISRGQEVGLSIVLVGDGPVPIVAYA